MVAHSRRNHRSRIPFMEETIKRQNYPRGTGRFLLRHAPKKTPYRLRWTGHRSVHRTNPIPRLSRRLVQHRSVAERGRDQIVS